MENGKKLGGTFDPETGELTGEMAEVYCQLTQAGAAESLIRQELIKRSVQRMDAEFLGVCDGNTGA